MRSLLLFCFLTLCFATKAQTIRDSTCLTSAQPPLHLQALLDTEKTAIAAAMTAPVYTDLDFRPQHALRLLNKTFPKNPFGTFHTISTSSFKVSSDSISVHFGMFELAFATDADLEKAKRFVEQSGRNNFQSVLLIRFVTTTKDKSLVFLFSETPLHPLAQERLEAFGK